ncbi:hypothetical protein [Paraburkholderia sp. BCC1886]|uniref:hypothetical protein n=1 Tax=Paraburkholderia sp. BCC1886 TaxID=2562670 RepID=UPI001182A984|nr:hypothetical protein [Paraburkholderia sp. BCC1886]
MLPVRSDRIFFSTAIALVAAVALSSPTSFAASSDTRQPLVLDTQSGISDGQSGTVLQTAPLSRQPIVGARPIATPAELAPESSPPIVVAPYISLPGSGGTSQSQPRVAPRAQ